MSFEYIIEKVKKADFSQEPFNHVYIANLFNEKHFEEIKASKEINVSGVSSDEQLFEELFRHHYKVIEFPGTTINCKQYLSWHKDKSVNHLANTSCEGFGVVLRLMEAKSSIINELKDFLNSKMFQSAIAEKYHVDLSLCSYDAGIQKYLDGYEISPHPDVRRKALTYMVNINPSDHSEEANIHTQYSRFKPQYEYIYSYWNGNKTVDRCWVPWDWCETKKRQKENNSMVIFSPSNDTLHAVKAEYDHFKFQRTQLYGNFWYKNPEKIHGSNWEDLKINSRPPVAPRSRLSFVKSILPDSIVEKIRDVKSGSSKNVGKRNY